MHRLGLIALFVLAACRPRVDPQSPFEEDDPRAGDVVEPEAAPTYEQLPEAPSGPGVRVGTIERDDLVAALDQGPGPILGRVEVTAEHDGDRFLGWRLVSVDPKHPPFPGVDLQPGDVLIAINGRSIARPDELDKVWGALRTADEIVADLERDGAKFQLRWIITG
jgi:type II secretory pathway component PulC